MPESLDDYIAEDNPVRVVDVFVDELDLREMGFEGAEPEATGRPSYHPGTLLKIYIYGYLNRIPVEPALGAILEAPQLRAGRRDLQIKSVGIVDPCRPCREASPVESAIRSRLAFNLSSKGCCPNPIPKTPTVYPKASSGRGATREDAQGQAFPGKSNDFGTIGDVKGCRRRGFWRPPGRS